MRDEVRKYSRCSEFGSNGRIVLVVREYFHANLEELGDDSNHGVQSVCSFFKKPRK